MINVKINGKAIQVPEDTTILAAAKMANVKIPSLCYNSDLPCLGIMRYLHSAAGRNDAHAPGMLHKNGRGHERHHP